jgi:formylglycine-generating enzyme required for sulfatase activity
MMPPGQHPVIGKAEDIAVLELVAGADAPADASPAFLLGLDNFFDRPVRVCGFPEGMDEGDWVEGELNGVIGTGRVQLDPLLGSRTVAYGFSGAPVWDKRTNTVIGMIVSIADRAGGMSAYMIPVATLMIPVATLREAARAELERQWVRAAQQREDEKQRAEAAQQEEAEKKGQRAEAARAELERQWVQAAQHHEEEKRRAEAAQQEEEKKGQRAEAAGQAEDERRVNFAVFRDAPFAPELVVIPAGEFWMGSSKEEEGRTGWEAPRHLVTISRRFAIGRYPVTFGEYDRFCEAKQREKPSDHGWGRARRPVINVSWQDAGAYIAWLSQEARRAYRLPSEAEWEYACRAGTETRYSFGDAITPNDANFAESGVVRSNVVGAYPPNPWKLYDMHGNVWEWVEDDWHEDYERAPDDGSARRDEATDPRSRRFVVRGGSWFFGSRFCRSANRDRNVFDKRFVDLGFRVARTLG